MPDLNIRPATERDVPEILSLIKALAEYEKLTHMVQADEARLRATLFSMEPGATPAAEVLLADYAGQCAGFAVFFPTYSTFLAQPGIHLEDLFIRPHLRRKGIGLALLKRLAAIAAARGCGRLEWEVLNWNQPAIDFYRRLGARPVSESTGDGWTKFRLTPETFDSVGL